MFSVIFGRGDYQKLLGREGKLKKEVGKIGPHGFGFSGVPREEASGELRGNNK